MSDFEFLKKIAAYRTDRGTKEEGFTVAGVLMFGKEDAIVVFADLIKVELGKNEQRSKFLVDAVKQMRQGNDVFSKNIRWQLVLESC